ncbi:hypothetical protein HDU93_006587, partial [Gonapodya sp. JEL0774]
MNTLSTVHPIVVMYARMSQEKKENVSIEVQFDHIRRELKVKGFGVYSTFYQDLKSGASRPGYGKTDRSGLEDCLRLVCGEDRNGRRERRQMVQDEDGKTGQLIGVGVYRLNRVSRDAGVFFALKTRLGDAGKGLYISSQFDYSFGPLTKNGFDNSIQIHFATIQAESERSALRERTKSALYHRRQKGQCTGRIAPLGEIWRAVDLNGEWTYGFTSEQLRAVVPANSTIYRVPEPREQNQLKEAAIFMEIVAMKRGVGPTNVEIEYFLHQHGLNVNFRTGACPMERIQNFVTSLKKKWLPRLKPEEAEAIKTEASRRVAQMDSAGKSVDQYLRGSWKGYKWRKETVQRSLMLASIACSEHPEVPSPSQHQLLYSSQ